MDGRGQTVGVSSLLHCGGPRVEFRFLALGTEASLNSLLVALIVHAR